MRLRLVVFVLRLTSVVWPVNVVSFSVKVGIVSLQIHGWFRIERKSSEATVTVNEEEEEEEKEYRVLP